jgi:predicted O-methyltransferase YrrM
MVAREHGFVTLPVRLRPNAYPSAVPPLATIPRRALVRLGKLTLRARYRDRPVPLDHVLRLQAFARDPESMTYHRSSRVRSTGAALSDPFLASRLADVELGNWIVAAATMNYLEQAVYKTRPSLVVEFGSGVSTACFARYLKELGEAGAVVSVEESEEHCRRTASLLASLGLAERADVLHAPLVSQVVEGIATLSYAIPAEVCERLGRSEPAFVFVDGPATGGSMGRYGALALLRPHLLPGTLFYLDDALTSHGLAAMHAWSGLPGLLVEGVSFVGHGLGVGWIAGPELIPPASGALRTRPG